MARRGRTRPISGGGYGQGQLTHALGLVMRLVPDLRATDVAAFTAGPGAQVELHDAIAIRFEGGAIGSVGGASLPLGSFGNQHQLQIRITGRRGQVLLDLAMSRVARSTGGIDVEVELSDEDVRWSFDRVTDRMVDLVLGPDDGQSVAGVARGAGRRHPRRDVPERRLRPDRAGQPGLTPAGGSVTSGWIGIRTPARTTATGTRR